MYPVYRGVARQRGHGLGDMFKSVFRTVAPVVSPILKPMVTRGLNALKGAALTHGKELIKNVIVNRQNPKDAFLTAGKNVLLQTGKELFGQQASPINALNATKPSIPTSLRTQKGRGRKRQRSHATKTLYTSKARKTKKRRTTRDLDIFDY